MALHLSQRGGRADLRIQIPPVNVLNIAALEELSRRISEARSCRLLVLSGLPKAFSAGVEVAEHVPEPDRIEAMLAAMRAVLTLLVQTPAVTIAAVEGACLGGGAEIAAACDIVLAAEDARVGFPEIRLACFPPGGAVLLPVRIGEARAADWILTGRTFSGREAAEAGFASRAVPAKAVAAETGRLADYLLSLSPEALSTARDLIRQKRREAIERDLPRAEAAYRGLCRSKDLQKAVQEFISQRSPSGGRRQ